MNDENIDDDDDGKRLEARSDVANMTVTQMFFPFLNVKRHSRKKISQIWKVQFESERPHTQGRQNRTRCLTIALELFGLFYSRTEGLDPY